MNVRVFIAALLTAAALFICLQCPAIAAPALWVVQGPAGKVYLFGTVHMLRDSTQWRSPELEAAMSDSQDLYLEIADANDAASAMRSMVKSGFDRDHPLSTKVSKTDVSLLDAAAKRYGWGSEATFEPMRPWFAYMMLAAAPSMHSGYTAGNGVDLQVRKEFAAAGKPIHGFETFDMQSHILADLPESTQIAMLESELENLDKQTTGNQIDGLVTVWLSGDEDALAKRLQLDKYADAPIYSQIFTNRNKAWAAAIAERLKQPGTSFVSVGAGHLAGPEGVPALLQKMGFAVTRVHVADVPSSLPSAQASSTPPAPSSVTPSPTPVATTTPKPAAITPPDGWKYQSSSRSVGQLRFEGIWIDPNRRGLIMTSHMDVEGLTSADLDTLDVMLHQGLVAAAGPSGVEPSKHVKVCNGKQDALYTKVAMKDVKEDIVLAVSDRGYLAQYVRRIETPDDPAAMKALFSLCAP